MSFAIEPRMTARIRCRTVLSAAILVVSGAARHATAQNDTPRIAWRIVDYAGVSTRVLQLAKAEARRVYTSIGVDLQLEGEMGAAAPRTVSVIILDAHRADQKDLSSHALGAAPGTPTGRGSIAYILYDRVESAARRHGRVTGELLGLVIAHEIGHLLLPYNAHTPNSIMQGDWNEAFMLAAPAVTFSPDQASLIRAGLSEAPDGQRAAVSENR
jgi:hypothetical protein